MYDCCKLSFFAGDISYELELIACTIQIVMFTVDLEVGIAV